MLTSEKNLNIGIFLLCSTLLASILLMFSYFISKRLSTNSKYASIIEKYSPYECGFQSFGDARFRFDVHFYLVAISFVIFDLEVILLYPWASELLNLPVLSSIAGFVFIFILSLGLFYEWKKGILDWNDSWRIEELLKERGKSYKSNS